MASSEVLISKTAAFTIDNADDEARGDGTLTFSSICKGGELVEKVTCKAKDSRHRSQPVQCLVRLRRVLAFGDFVSQTLAVGPAPSGCCKHQGSDHSS